MPFALSLSKYLHHGWRGFDKLSPNGNLWPAKKKLAASQSFFFEDDLLELDLLLDFFGTLAPSLRASDSPMATA